LFEPLVTVGSATVYGLVGINFWALAHSAPVQLLDLQLNRDFEARIIQALARRVVLACGMEIAGDSFFQ
jgi:hypothetical protein